MAVMTIPGIGSPDNLCARAAQAPARPIARLSLEPVLCEWNQAPRDLSAFVGAGRRPPELAEGPRGGRRRIVTGGPTAGLWPAGRAEGPPLRMRRGPLSLRNHHASSIWRTSSAIAGDEVRPGDSM